MVENIDKIYTLRDFWNNAIGVVVDFVNLNGESVDDMEYPLETHIKSIRHIGSDEYEVTLDV